MSKIQVFLTFFTEYFHSSFYQKGNSRIRLRFLFMSRNKSSLYLIVFQILKSKWFNIAAKNFAHQNFTHFVVMTVNIFPCLWPYFTTKPTTTTTLRFSYRGRVMAAEGILDPVHDPQWTLTCKTLHWEGLLRALK